MNKFASIMFGLSATFFYLAMIGKIANGEHDVMLIVDFVAAPIEFFIAGLLWRWS